MGEFGVSELKNADLLRKEIEHQKFKPHRYGFTITGALAAAWLVFFPLGLVALGAFIAYGNSAGAWGYPYNIYLEAGIGFELGFLFFVFLFFLDHYKRCSKLLSVLEDKVHGDYSRNVALFEWELVFEDELIQRKREKEQAERQSQ